MVLLEQGTSKPGEGGPAAPCGAASTGTAPRARRPRGCAHPTGCPAPAAPPPAHAGRAAWACGRYRVSASGAGTCGAPQVQVSGTGGGADGGARCHGAVVATGGFNVQVMPQVRSAGASLPTPHHLPIPLTTPYRQCSSPNMPRHWRGPNTQPSHPSAVPRSPRRVAHVLVRVVQQQHLEVVAQRVAHQQPPLQQPRHLGLRGARLVAVSLP